MSNLAWEVYSDLTTTHGKDIMPNNNGHCSQGTLLRKPNRTPSFASNDEPTTPKEHEETHEPDQDTNTHNYSSKKRIYLETCHFVNDVEHDSEDSSSQTSYSPFSDSLFIPHSSMPCKRTKRHSSCRQTVQPRWHNQSYMLFLALRQHPDNSLPRTDLIKAALALDKKMSEERDLPRVFRGKTPMNSASAILTNNSDGYFIPFKPHGSRSMHFKLAETPKKFEKACLEYRQWEEHLEREKWPDYFGYEEKIEPLVHEEEITEFDEFIASRLRARQANLHPSNGRILEDESVKDKEKELEITHVSYEQRHTEHLHNIGNMPTSWKDLVRVDKGKGVFAVRPLPQKIPLGFYFGAPMPEDKFESLKESVGSADT
ncbi:hypothetical protein PHYBLDRAFT_179571 [Phycomyces blakesleeanus NRRL 1555(-)]|uniref:Uncharacterized protein n=2 Tax=Phycomyces blakesleeanus TaxID=4837 RepID=A0A167PTI2_PHYB8|nr:hypothetical protein PHYBLDRAFT_179571 [Phycomyces blakesleeanus NRRL 1555(-)]OAD78509.1 hypothetical protein PHYBLDRAFT_179571 [Phycomyces blakesleeanus NRRL 1555(-)]|eukprot:XP_018296549.1 hypothetical protein PHYBLDRAFT_179571 [Phycomyces blakesleeanus NRRL 1555(-)]